MRKTIYSIIVVVIMLSACDKDPEIGGTAMEKMAGDWFVQIEGAGDYYHFSTYNTADNSLTEMWLDDMGNFYDPSAKGKVNVDLNQLTFSGENIQSIHATPAKPLTFTVTEGKIIKNAATGPGSKTTTDSIYFKIEFSDDPGTVYTLSGYKRTGFLEDEH